MEVKFLPRRGALNIRFIVYGAVAAIGLYAGYAVFVAWPKPIDNSALMSANRPALYQLRAQANAPPTPRVFVAPKPFVRPRLPDDASTLTRLAAAGNADAQCKLSNAYEKGDIVAADFRKARQLMIDGAARHNGCSINGLGNIYLVGLGVKSDVGAALSYYKAAASVGYPSAYFNIGRIYENGWGVMPNDRLAFQWYEKAADAGSSDAYAAVAAYYADGTGGVADRFLAEQYYTLAANAGDRSAMEDLALLYIADDKLPGHFQLAKRWLTADSKSPAAQYELGWMSETGNGLQKDIGKAAYWYKLSAGQHYAQAETAYARLLQSGRVGGSPDPSGAARYYAAGSNDGDPQAMYELGLVTQSGTGVRKNPVTAEKLFFLSAMRGDPDALILLAYRYRDGSHGYRRDLERSQALAMVAGEHGASADQVTLLAPARSTVDGAKVYSLMLQLDRTIAVYSGASRGIASGIPGAAGPVPTN